MITILHEGVYSILFSFLEYGDAASLFYLSKDMKDVITKYYNYFYKAPWLYDVIPRIISNDNKIIKISKDRIQAVYHIFNSIKGQLSPILPTITEGKRVFDTHLNEYNAEIMPIEIYILEWLVMNFSKHQNINIMWNDVIVGDSNIYELSTKGGVWIFQTMTYLDVFITDTSYNSIPICKKNLDSDTVLYLMYDIFGKCYYFCEQIAANSLSEPLDPRAHRILGDELDLALVLDTDREEYYHSYINPKSSISLDFWGALDKIIHG